MIADGTLCDIRTAERVLHEACGLSRKQARALLAKGWRAVAGADAESEDDAPGADAGLADSLRSLIASFTH
jgi:hypothetical protein